VSISFVYQVKMPPGRKTLAATGKKSSAITTLSITSRKYSSSNVGTVSKNTPSFDSSGTW
jgi:hypothetical protein